MPRKHQPGDRVLTSVRKWSLGKSKNKGTKFIKVQLQGGITWTGYFHPNSMEKTMEALEIMGYQGSNINQIGAPNALDTETEVVAVILDSWDYQGKTYYNAKWINKNASFGFDEKSEDLLDDFNIDTRAYIDGAKDISPPASSEFGNSDLVDSHNFTANDIPF